MTYYEKYKALADRDEIMEQAKSDAKVALFLGGNPDRLKAIEDAMNKALDEASVGTERGETMSVSLWRWTEECDGKPCCGDCDECCYECEEDDNR